MKKNIPAVLIGLALALAAPAVQALTITRTLSSADFSLGFGAQGGGGSPVNVFNDVETAVTNTPTTQGHFTFSPVPYGVRVSGDGPTFVNRVLGDGASGGPDEVSACVQHSAGPKFTVPITASYDGPPPRDAHPTSPDYKLIVEITSISVHMLGAAPNWTADGQWEETTAGHTVTQATTTALGTGDRLLAGSYSKVVWDPGDYAVSLGSINESVAREFGIVVELASGADWRYVDAVEVEGRVHLVYLANAAALTSADFSFGFGAQHPSSASDVFNDVETAGVNTPATQGDFTFTPTVIGGRSGGFGCTFLNRVLADGVDGDVSAAVSRSGPVNFVVSIAGSYNGGPPAHAVSADYNLALEITSISVWAAAWPTYSTSAAWDETTPGHAATSPSMALIESNNAHLTSSYTQLVWDPDDYGVWLDSLNDSFTRTFAILPVVEGNDYRYLDGVEIEGRVHLIYDAAMGTVVLLR